MFLDFAISHGRPIVFRNTCAFLCMALSVRATTHLPTHAHTRRSAAIARWAAMKGDTRWNLKRLRELLRPKVWRSAASGCALAHACLIAAAAMMQARLDNIKTSSVPMFFNADGSAKMAVNGNPGIASQLKMVGSTACACGHGRPDLLHARAHRRTRKGT